MDHSGRRLGLCPSQDRSIARANSSKVPIRLLATATAGSVAVVKTGEWLCCEGGNRAVFDRIQIRWIVGEPPVAVLTVGARETEVDEQPVAAAIPLTQHPLQQLPHPLIQVRLEFRGQACRVLVEVRAAFVREALQAVILRKRLLRRSAPIRTPVVHVASEAAFLRYATSE